MKPDAGAARAGARNVIVVTAAVDGPGQTDRAAGALAQVLAGASGHVVRLVGLTRGPGAVGGPDGTGVPTAVLYPGAGDPGAPWAPQTVTERLDLRAHLGERRRRLLRAVAVRRLARIFAAVPDGIVIVMHEEAGELVAAVPAPHLRVIGRGRESFAAAHRAKAAAGDPRRAQLKRLFADADLFAVRTRADAVAFRRDGFCNVVVLPDPPTFWPAASARRTEPSAVAIADHRADGTVPALIDAWAGVRKRHPGWTLRVFGEGPDTAVLGEYAARRGMADAVVLAGAASAAPAALQAASFYVSAALHDVPPLLREAQACGLPCVAVNSGPGLREFVDDCDALLVPARRPDLLAAACSRLIGDGDLRHAMGSAAREKALRLGSAASAGRLWTEALAAVER